MASTSNENSSSHSEAGIDITNEIRPPVSQYTDTLIEHPRNRYYLRNAKRSLNNDSTGSKRRRTHHDMDLVYKGSFASAKDFGETTHKWLMVSILESFLHSKMLNVWRNAEVKNLISQHFILWQPDRNSRYGKWYLQFYKPDRFPYTAVIDPRTGEKMVVWQNVASPMMLCELMRAFLLEHHGSLENSSTESDLSEDSIIEHEHNIASSSLQETVVVSVDNNYGDAEFNSGFSSGDGKVFSTVSENQKSINTPDTSVHLADSKVLAKKWRYFLGNISDPNFEVIIRLPNGERKHVFWPCTSKVKALSLYLEEMGYSLNEYELLRIHPQYTFDPLDLSRSLEEMGLFHREVLFLQLKA